MSEINWNQIYEKLSAPFPREAIQRTKGEETKKHYDTSGIGYQYLVNRFNEVMVGQWGYEWEIIKTIEGKYGNGKDYFDITVKVAIWLMSPGNSRTLVGGHISAIYGDALKGAITNAFKKTAAMWGVGRQAYEGTLDDDASYEAEPSGKKKEEFQKALPEKEDSSNETDKQNEIKEPEIKTEDVTYLTFEELQKKMATSKNMFELKARCKKYKTSYKKLDKEHQQFIVIERDKRIKWLKEGIGIYIDEETRGINNPEVGEK